MASFQGHNKISSIFLILFWKTCSIKTYILASSFYSLAHTHIDSNKHPFSYQSFSLLLPGAQQLRELLQGLSCKINHTRRMFGKTDDILHTFAVSTPSFLDHQGTFSSHLYWSHHQSQHLQYIRAGTPAETERTAEQQEKDLRKTEKFIQAQQLHYRHHLFRTNIISTLFTNTFIGPTQRSAPIPIQATNSITYSLL